MFKLLISRFFQGLLTLFVLITITFFLVRAMPGSPYTSEKAIPKHILDEMNAYTGFDKPVHVQYGRYLKNLIIHQDLGIMFKKDGVKVYEIIRDSFPVSLALGMASMVIAMMVGIPTGVIAAVKKNTPTDFACLSFAMLGICLPSFVIGPSLAVGSLQIQAINVAGWSSPTDWILPAVTLGMINAAYLARLSRGGMLD
ncbi:MAG: ABC transporter permease, partial [Akkermansiaceae bacterium]